jgi:hypothetical protein
MRIEAIVAITLIPATVGCGVPSSTPGPPPPIESRVTAVRVSKLINVTRESWQITDRTAVSAIAQSPAFSAGIWLPALGRDLVPSYRVEFLRDSTVESIYFLGTNSYPPKFPCYWFCSGWWLGAAQPDGSFDPSRYSDIPESRYLRLLRELDFPSHIRKQLPNHRMQATAGWEVASYRVRHFPAAPDAAR